MRPATTSYPAARAVKEYFGHAARRGGAVGEPLDRLVRRFIQLKRDLGLPFQTEGRTLDAFLKRQMESGVTRPNQLTPAALASWTASLDVLSPGGRQARLRVVAEFLRHLWALGYQAVPVPEVPRGARRPEYRPYIFGAEKLRLLYAQADMPGAAGARAQVYALLHGCGLRVSEAVRLRIRDVDLPRGTLFIQNTKFNKDRLLPMPAHVRERLCRYRDAHRIGASPDARFFVDCIGRPYRAARLGTAFRDDLVHWGIWRPTYDADGIRWGSPRLHALRHTFSVERLLAWYAAGADVQSKLPLLATYLGHRSARETQVYLKITRLLLRAGHARFASRWEKEYPIEP